MNRICWDFLVNRPSQQLWDNGSPVLIDENK